MDRSFSRDCVYRFRGDRLDGRVHADGRTAYPELVGGHGVVEMGGQPVGHDGCNRSGVLEKQAKKSKKPHAGGAASGGLTEEHDKREPLLCGSRCSSGQALFSLHQFSADHVG